MPWPVVGRCTDSALPRRLYIPSDVSTTPVLFCSLAPVGGAKASGAVCATFALSLIRCVFDVSNATRDIPSLYIFKRFDSFGQCYGGFQSCEIFRKRYFEKIREFSALRVLYK